MARKKSSYREMEDATAYALVQYAFFSFPSKSMTLNDLTRITGTTKPTVILAARRLMEEGFLTKRQIGKAWLLDADRKHPYFVIRKIPENLRLIYGSGLIDEIRQRWPGAKSITLFGSYRNGTDDEQSDIDMAVELAGQTKPERVPLPPMTMMGYRRNVPVNCFVYSRKNVDGNVFANIANGIVLDGFLEVRP